MDRESLAGGVRGVRELGAVWGPCDVAVRHVWLAREIAFVLAVTIHEPDVESLVATFIAQEGDPPRVG